MENILIDNEGVVKIADFGASLIVPRESGDCTKPQKKLDHPVGTPAYMSPEMTESGKGNKTKDKYSSKTDIWGAGIVLFVMIYGHLPFTGDKSRDEEQTQQELFAAIKSEPVFCKETVSIPCIKLINSLLDKNPKNRLDIGQILNHPWFSHNEKENRGDVFNPFEVDKIKSGFLFRDLELDRNDHVNPRHLNDDFMFGGKKYSKDGYRIITKNH